MGRAQMEGEMRKIAAIAVLAVLMLAYPVCAGAFEDKTAIPEPVVSKQRAQQVIIRGENGQALAVFVFAYDDDGLPAGFAVADGKGQVFLNVPLGNAQ